MTEPPLFRILFDESESQPFSVTELNARIRSTLEKQFADVWVEGEITSFTAAASGHWYFVLNDGSSQIKAVCWRTSNFRIRFRPSNGLTVRVRGRLSVYEPRGEYQVVVESLEPAGEGALRAAFEQIRTKLDGEGLFAPEVKRQIPFFPRRVAVITSANGAAYHDIHTVLTRRAASISILLVPALVQGEGAADSIRRGLTWTNQYNLSLESLRRIDVVIVGRGGGSAEDLWAFNDERLARAIRASEIPVISAVGHEIDWSISDMVADLRAATPSAAAEMVAQRQDEIEQTFRARDGQMVSLMEYQMLETSRRFTDADLALRTNVESIVQEKGSAYSLASTRLTPLTIRARSAELMSRLASADQASRTAIERNVAAKNESFGLNLAKLNALSPLGVLDRGYSITRTDAGGIVRDATQVRLGEKLKIRLQRGTLNAEVISSDTDEEPSRVRE